MKALILMLVAMFGTSYAAEFKSTEVGFSAVGNPGFLKIKAMGGKASGSWDVKYGKGSGKFECDLSGLNTGIDLRDEHMKDRYLEVKKFPKALLVIDPVAVSESFDWSGKLTLKGVTKPVKGKAKIKDGLVEAEFSINIEDWPKLGIPSHLGVTMAKNVDVWVIGKL